MKFQVDWKAVLMGTVGGLLAVVTVSAVFAGLISGEILGIEYLNVGSATALILGGAVAGIRGGRGADRWGQGVITGLGLLLLLLLINLIGFGGKLDGVLPCGLLVMGSAGGSCLVMGGKKRRKRRKYQIKKYRTG